VKSRGLHMRLAALRRFRAHLFHCSILTCSAARVRRLGSFFQIAFLRVIFFFVSILRLLIRGRRRFLSQSARHFAPSFCIRRKGLSPRRQERQEQQECAAYGARHHQFFRSLRSLRLGEKHVVVIRNG